MGVYAQLNNKNGIRYIGYADQMLYDISKEDATYKGKAAKAYFAVRDGLYKGIKQNTSISKIDTTALMALYRMESDSINTLYDILKDSSDVNLTELLITHSARQMAIATMMDMINDNSSKFSLLSAFNSYIWSYFSKEFYDKHFDIIANTQLNYNQQIKIGYAGLSNDTITTTREYDQSFSLDAKFSNKDFSTLGVLSLWQYVYVNTMSLTIMLYKKYMNNLQSKIDEIAQLQRSVLGKLKKPLPVDSKNVNKAIANYDMKKVAELAMGNLFRKNSEQKSLVDSLASIIDKYKSFSPFSFFNKNSMKNVRSIANKNISIFDTLYDSCSKRNDYHYAIFRQKLIDNLLLASFCGRDIINDVKCLELKDSTYFKQTYKYMRNLAKEVKKTREEGKVLKDILKQLKKALQRNPIYSTLNLLNFEK